MVFCPDGITPNPGLTGPNNTTIYTYIYIYMHTHPVNGTKNILTNFPAERVKTYPPKKGFLGYETRRQFQGSLTPRVEVPVRVPSMGQIDLEIY